MRRSVGVGRPRRRASWARVWSGARRGCRGDELIGLVPPCALIAPHRRLVDGGVGGEKPRFAGKRPPSVIREPSARLLHRQHPRRIIRDLTAVDAGPSISPRTTWGNDNRRAGRSSSVPFLLLLRDIHRVAVKFHTPLCFVQSTPQPYMTPAPELRDSVSMQAPDHPV